MKIKSEEFLNIGSIIFLIGSIIESFFISDSINEIIAKILYYFVMPFGGLLVIYGAIKLSKEQRGFAEAFSGEELENKKQSKFSKYIFPVISILVSLGMIYWFDMRPIQIRQKCIKEAAATEIDFVGNYFSDSPNVGAQIESVFKECLNRHGLKK